MKRTAWFWIAMQFILLPVLPQATASASPKDEATPPRFECDTGYTLERCNKDMTVLRAALAKYPVAQLGNWTWVLVRSQDWKAILLPRGLNPDSPAFSYLEKRVTFVEEALVAEVPVRRRELLLKWRMTIGELLDLSIAHEMAHALCGEKDEAKTTEVAKSMQEGRPFSCKANTAAKIQARHMSYRQRLGDAGRHYPSDSSASEQRGNITPHSLLKACPTFLSAPLPKLLAG